MLELACFLLGLLIGLFTGGVLMLVACEREINKNGHLTLGGKIFSCTRKELPK